MAGKSIKNKPKSRAARISNAGKSASRKGGRKGGKKKKGWAPSGRVRTRCWPCDPGELLALLNV